jgi:hypothetical protein
MAAHKLAPGLLTAFSWILSDALCGIARLQRFASILEALVEQLATFCSVDCLLKHLGLKLKQPLFEVLQAQVRLDPAAYNNKQLVCCLFRPQRAWQGPLAAGGRAVVESPGLFLLQALFLLQLQPLLSCH